MSVQNTALNNKPSQFFHKEAWLNIVLSAYNFLSASTTLVQALDNKYSTPDQPAESTSKHEVDQQLDECPFFINMITESTPTEISLHKVDEEVLDVPSSKELNKEILEQNDISCNGDINEELDLSDITNKTLDHDLNLIESSHGDFADYQLHLPDISLNNYLNHEFYFPEIVNKFKQSDLSLDETSPNEIMNEKLDLADISLNKILNYDLMSTEIMSNTVFDPNLNTKDIICDYEISNNNNTSEIDDVGEDQIPKVLCSELNVHDDTRTTPMKSIISTPKCLSIDSIINTALDTLCLLEAAILDIEHSEQKPRLLNLIYNDPFEELKSSNQNKNILLTKSDDLKEACLTDLESITNTHSQSQSTINSAAMDTLDTTIDTTNDPTIDTDTNDKSNLALSLVGSDRMIEVDIELQKVINDTTQIKPKTESKEEINKNPPTVNRRFEGTLKAQINKQPEIQRELLEYSREQNSQKTIDFPASIQKLKQQLDKISEEGKKSNQRKLYNHIVHISDMVTQLEYEHEEHLKNNPIARKNLINKNRANNLSSKKDSRPPSPMKKTKSDPPVLPKKSESKTEDLLKATKMLVENKAIKNKIQSPKKKPLVKPKPVPNLRMMEDILNTKFVNTVNDKLASRNITGSINLTNVEAIIPKSKSKKNARRRHALDEIFPKIEVVTSIANQKNFKCAEHIFEFRPTSSSEGRGRLYLNHRTKKHIYNV